MTGCTAKMENDFLWAYQIARLAGNDTFTPVHLSITAGFRQW
jgi:hypothetical protein